MKVDRVLATEEAKALIRELVAQHGKLIFHQSGGCCDGSAPMCFAEGEFFIDGNDVLLGTVEDCAFYMSRDQFEYWKHTQLTIDIVTGRGSSFSLEIPTGKRFITKSKLFSNEALQNLHN